MFEDLTRLRPQVGRHWGCLGVFFSERGARVKAAVALQHSVAIDQQTIRLKPDDVAAHYNLGRAFFIQGKPEEAIAEFRTVIRLKPDDAKAHSILAAVFCDIKNDYKAAVAEFRNAIQLQPDDSLYHRNLGVALSKQGHLEEAIAEQRTAIRLKPDDAKAHYSLGWTLQERGNLEEAIAEYRTAVRLDPDHFWAHSNLGKILAEQGHLEEAIAEQRTAIRLKPDEARLHVDLGWTLRQRGNLEAAVAEFRTAIRLDPDSVWAHLDLGIVLNAQGHLEEASAEYKELLRLNPDDARAHNALAWNLVLSPDHPRRDYDEALEHSRKAVKLAPKSGDYFNTLALAEYRAGHATESIAAGERSMTLRNGGDASDWFFLAMAHWQKREKDRARKWFEKAVAWAKEKDPKNAELRQFWKEAAALLGQAAPDAPGSGSPAAPVAP